MDYFSITFPEEFYNSLKISLKIANKPDERWFFVKQGEGAYLREELNNVLEVAYRHEVIDQQFLDRLRSKNEDTFFQAIQELRFAYFMEKKLGKIIEFSPPGKNNRILDLAIFLPDQENILVEIKSYFKPIRGDSGFIVGDDKDKIKHDIDKATDQLPKNSINMVVIAGRGKHNFANDFAGMLEVLYSPSPVSYHTKKKIKRELGLFLKNDNVGKKINTRISAVAGFGIWPNGESVEYQFEVYHNPFAEKAIDPKYFNPYPQFVKCTETEPCTEFLECEKGMKWINRRTAK